LTIETGVLSNTSGSSRLRLVFIIFLQRLAKVINYSYLFKKAATDVLVGIKVELGRPLPGQDEGL
jgi:hypothetical protein